MEVADTELVLKTKTSSEHFCISLVGLNIREDQVKNGVFCPTVVCRRGIDLQECRALAENSNTACGAN